MTWADIQSDVDAVSLETFGETAAYTSARTWVSSSVTASRFHDVELLNEDTGQYERRTIAYVDQADVAQPYRGDKLVWSGFTGLVDGYREDGDLWRLVLRKDLTA